MVLVIMKAPKLDSPSHYVSEDVETARRAWRLYGPSGCLIKLPIGPQVVPFWDYLIGF